MLAAVTSKSNRGCKCNVSLNADSSPRPHDASRHASSHHASSHREPSIDEPDSGYVFHTTPGASRVYGKQPTKWEHLRSNEDPTRPFAPWADEEEFELVKWYISARLKKKDIDVHIKLRIVSLLHSGRPVIEYLLVVLDATQSVVFQIGRRNVQAH